MSLLKPMLKLYYSNFSNLLLLTMICGIFPIAVAG